MRKTGAPVAVSDGYAVAASGLIHRIWEPSSPGPHKTVIMLHGRSGDEDVMWIFAKTVPPDWLLVAPRGIHQDPNGGYVWLPRAEDEWPTLSQFDDAVTAVSEFASTLPDLYDADPEQLFLMGFSQGAAVSFATAICHPDMIRGIASLVGFIPVECDDSLEISPLKALPIFMAVGKRDTLIPLSRTDSCAQTLYTAGAHLDYREYETGHKLNKQGFDDLTQWWLARDAEG